MKVAKTPIFLFNGSCIFHTTGNGRQKIKKSVTRDTALCDKPPGISLAASAEIIAAGWLWACFGVYKIT